MPRQELTATHQSLYPEKSSLYEAMQSAQAALPITDVNSLTSVMMTYHNTLLRTVNEQAKEHF